MLYKVQARPIEVELRQFYQLLTDRTIASQEPDGREIIASMKRATLKNGLVSWTETCYCNPPLNHERKTVYDRFFTDMKILPAEAALSQSETSFWTHLEAQRPQTTVSEETALSGIIARSLGRNTV